MEQVLKRLYDVENAAAAIMDQTETRKRELDAENAARTAEFDRKLEEKTAATLDRLRSDLNKQNEEALRGQQEKTEEILRRMEESYQRDHTKLAYRILQQLMQ